MLAVILSLKLWSEELRGKRILVRSDNQSNEPAINTGRSRVPFVQSCLRELWFYASRFDFEPFISGATRTPLLILSVAGTLIHNLNTPSTRPPTFITAP